MKLIKWGRGVCGLVLLLGCSQNYSEKKGDEAIREKGLQPASPKAEQTQLPAGHPPLDPAASGAGAPVQAGQRQSLGGMSLVLPEGWRAVPPASSMRKAEYVLPGEGGGDASLVVFYFGPDQGGSVEDNIERWYGQFTQPDGRSTEEVSRRWEKQAGGMPVALVDISGTYSAGMGMGGGSQGPQTGHRMLGAIIGAPAGSFFFKLVGPAQTVTRWAASFEEFIGSAQAE